jgi:hypothetical protein
MTSTSGAPVLGQWRKFQCIVTVWPDTGPRFALCVCAALNHRFKKQTLSLGHVFWLFVFDTCIIYGPSPGLLQKNRTHYIFVFHVHIKRSQNRKVFETFSLKQSLFISDVHFLETPFPLSQPPRFRWIYRFINYVPHRKEIAQKIGR